VLLLDFDGTLAPIVSRPELAAMPPVTRAALDRLRGCAGVSIAIVSGRGLADARERAALEGIAYAGNHGLEIEGPSLRRIHEEAVRARPHLEEAAAAIGQAVRGIEGAFVEDKYFTLSIHDRLVAPEEMPRVRAIVREAAGRFPELRVTEGKQVLEVRPDVDWHKGRAVEFLLDNLDVPAGAPVLYLGDDRTDEDAFEVLRARAVGEGIVVAESAPAETAATSYLRDPVEVGTLLTDLADEGC
jgi:trehalose 6-phosphate phosphatase